MLSRLKSAITTLAKRPEPKLSVSAVATGTSATNAAGRQDIADDQLVEGRIRELADRVAAREKKL